MGRRRRSVNGMTTTTTNSSVPVRLEFDSHAPGFARALAKLDQAATEELDRVEFDPQLRELVRVRASQLNGCLYCLVAHGAALRDALGDPVLGERISYDWRRAGLDERRTATCAYAEKLTLTPRELTRLDLQTLLDVGLTLEEAWDVAEVAAMYNFTNRMAMATNMLPNPQYSGQARPA